MKENWSQILIFLFLPKAPLCSTNTLYIKCRTQPQATQIKCTFLAWNVLYPHIHLFFGGKPVLKGKAGRRRPEITALQSTGQQAKLYLQTAITWLPHYKNCPEISILCHTPHLPKMTILVSQEVTKLGALGMCHFYQRPCTWPVPRIWRLEFKLCVLQDPRT
jgi:hypothetical protein